MSSRRLDVLAFTAVVFAAMALFISLQENTQVGRSSFSAAAPVATATAPDGQGPKAAQAPQAAVPPTFNYQGVLRQADGSLANASYNITLRLYDAVAGGNMLHQETFPNVSVRDGIFNVVLGDDAGNPLNASVFSDAPRYLGITTGADPEMTPRQRLHPVPWALQANTAFVAQQANNASLAALASSATTLVNPANVGTLNVNGALNAGGDVMVGGELGATVLRDAGNGANGSVSGQSYVRSLRRYVVEAADGGNSPYTVPVDDAILVQLCGDVDGCEVSLGMRDWQTASVGPGAIASVGPYRFSFSATRPNGQRYWDVRSVTSGSGGWDGNNGVDHVMVAYDTCYFTDGQYLAASGSDPGLGFGLLTWAGGYTATDLGCILIIDD